MTIKNWTKANTCKLPKGSDKAVAYDYESRRPFPSLFGEVQLVAWQSFVINDEGQVVESYGKGTALPP